MTGAMKYSHRLAAILTACCLLVPFGGCAPAAPGGFAIYLTRDNLSPEQIAALSDVEIAEAPIVSTDDIVSYDPNTHEMDLTGEAIERLVELEVPVSGTSFVVCVDGQPVYPGAFWVLYSSLLFEGVTIYKPLSAEDPTPVQLQLGYPSTEFYDGEDPRSSQGVLNALEEAGKLKSISYASTCPLPHSMKGYELYSWQDRGEWHFTLISGTNRSKTAAEIHAPIYVVTDDGWVQLHVTRFEDVKAALGRLPAGEDVVWISDVAGGNEDIVFSLPSHSIVDELVGQAKDLGLQLHVAVH